LSFFEDLETNIKNVVSHDGRPVVIYSSIWPLMNVAKRKDREFVSDLLNKLFEVFEGRTLLMPTFARGFQDGVCNLDQQKSSTGVLTEAFRVHPDSRRTKSAFFPFSYIGDEKGELDKLVSKHSWGENSIYEWMEINDVDFLMLGTDATHCSYLHRLELLAKEVINYRYDKDFEGTMILEGKEFPFKETLYVRRLDPPVVNDFRILESHMKEMGMKESDFEGVRITGYTAKQLKDAILPIIQKDPFYTVKNKEDYMETK
jgi:aminoglycoside N3'-acetyltransferase